MTTSAIRDVSNPACVGFEFTSRTPGWLDTVWQFVFLGSGRVFFSTKYGANPWGPTTPIVNPERFGAIPEAEPTRAARKMGRAWVEAFNAASSEDCL